MKKILLTHIDLDGCGCLLNAQYFEQEFDKIMCCDYKMYEDPDFDYQSFMQYEEIVFTDFSPNEEFLDLVIKSNVKLKVFDHHRSFYDIYESQKSMLDTLTTKNIEIHFDNTKSGTLIYFEWLKTKYPNKTISKAMQTIVEGIDTYDLFRKERDNWELANNLNRVLWRNINWWVKDESPRKFEKMIDLIYSKAIGDKPFSFNMYEDNGIHATIEKEELAFKQARKQLLIRTDEQGHKFGIARMKSKVSVTASKILEAYKQLDYILVINEFNKSDIRLSGRAKDDFNLLKLNYTKGHTSSCGAKGLSQRRIEMLWRGRDFYELGYDPNYVEDTKELEVIHEHY